MEEKDWLQILADFSATKQARPNLTEGEWLQKFPEFNNDSKLLQAAFDYDATVQSGKYSDVGELQSKFPEFWPQVPGQEDASDKTEIPTVTMEQVEQQASTPDSNGHFLGNVSVGADMRPKPMESNPLRNETESGSPVGTERAKETPDFETPTEYTQENFMKVLNRSKELTDERKRLNAVLDSDSEFEPLTISQKQQYESRLNAIDEEMNGLGAFIDEWSKTDEARAYYDWQKQQCAALEENINQYASKMRDQRVQRQRERDESRGFWSTMANGLMAAENPITPEAVDVLTNPDENNIRAAQNEIRNAKNQLKLEEMRMNGEMKGLAFLRGMETANYYELIPAIGLADAASILSLSQDVEEGKELSETQQMLYDAMKLRAGVDFSYQDNNTIWERVGQSAPEQIAFTLQFVVGAGLTGATEVGERVAAKSAQKAAMRYARNGVNSGARRFVGGTVMPKLEGMAVSATMQTFMNPLSLADMAEDFERRYAGDIYYDNNGNLHVFDNDRSAGQAAYQAIASAWIENFTEYAGENITKGVKLVDSKMFDLAGKFDNVVKRVGAGKIQDVFSIPQQLGHLTQIGSAPEEFLEEELGSVMNALFATDANRGESYGDAFKRTIGQSFSSDQQLETLLSCTVTSMLLGGGGNAVNAVGNAGYRRYINQDVERSKALLGKVHGIDIAELDNQIENGEISDIASYLKAQSDANGWSQDEQGAAVSYVLNRARQIGMRHSDETAIEEAQQEMRQQAEDMANRWDGNIYNATWKDGEGNEQPVTIINGRVHYTTRENGSIHFNPYTSSGMFAIRLADGTKKQVASRTITGIQSVMSVDEQLEAQGQTIPQMMRSQFEQEGMVLPTVESVWGGNLEANVTQLENGKYTYLGQDQNGLYAFANNDKKTQKDNPIVYMTERQLVEYGLSLNIQSADEEQRRQAQEDMEFMDDLDRISQATDGHQWDVVKAYAGRHLQFEDNGMVSVDTDPRAYAPYLLACSEGSFENAVASIDQSIAALVSAQGQQAQAADVSADPGFNAETHANMEHLDETTAKAIDFYTNTRNALIEMQQGQQEAKEEETANTPVSQMEVGTEFPIDIADGAVARVEGKDADGRSIVSVYDVDGNIMEAGIDDWSDEFWEGVRVRPQAAMESQQEGTEQESSEIEQNPPTIEQNPDEIEQKEPEIEQKEETPLSPAQQTYNDLVQKYGEKAGHKIDVTAEDKSKTLDKAKKALEKAQQEYDDAPIGKEEKAEAALEKAQQEYETALAEQQEWNDVKSVKDRFVAEQLAALQAAEEQRRAEAVAEEQARQEAEERKAQERAELGSNNVAPSIREKWDSAIKAEGNADEITLANGERVTGHYVLVESGAASPSHNALDGFRKTEGFPMDENEQSVNDRDYERDQHAQSITRQIAADYDNRALQTPVVVSQDGVVLSGNGRTMAGEIAAAQNTDGAYIDYLKKYAQKYGFAPEEVEAMNHPRVVFVPDASMPYTAETFAKFNQQEMKGQSKTEQAVKLGKLVDDATFGRIIRSINRFDTLGDFYADSKATADAIGELLNAGAINQMQHAEMFDGESISAQGREILENMLIGKAFESNPDAVRQLTAYKSLRQSVITALAEISNNIALGENYSLENELSQAIALAYQARQNGYKAGDRVSEFARTGVLFQGEALTVAKEGATAADYTNATVLMLADLLNDNRVTRLKKALQVYNHQAEQSAGGQTDLFAGDVRTQQDILNEVLVLLQHGTESEQQQAIDDAVEQRKSAAEQSVQQDGVADASHQEERGAETAEEETVGGGNEELHVPQVPQTSEEIEGENPSDEGFFLKPDVEVERIRSLRQALADGYASGNKEAIQKAVDELKKYVDEGLDTDGYYSEEIDDYEGDDPMMLAERYITHLYQDRYLDDDEDQEYIKTGIRSVAPQENAIPEQSGYTISPAQYTTKKGKVLDMHLVKFDKALTKEQQRAANALARDLKGWWSREDGGFMMRDEATSRQLIDAVLEESGETLQDAAPLSLADMRGETEQAGPTDSSVAAANEEVDTNPTEAQKEAGNYKKGHVKIDGFDISIENPAGSTRSGTDAQGNPWSVTMHNSYGYIRMTEGVDGDHIDIFLSDHIDDWDGTVYVVDQVNEDGSFDEHKVMYGFNSAEEAMEAYLSNYSEGWHGLGTITGVSREEFKKWVDSSHRKTKAFADYKSVQTTEGQNEAANTQPTEQPTTSTYGASNKLVSQSRYEELKRRMQEKLGGQMNMGIDPEILAIGTEMAVYHIEAGARKFADFCKNMVSDLGDAIRPYLKSFYNGARDLPEVDEAGYLDELTPYEEVKTFDVNGFDKGGSSFIETAQEAVKENEVAQQVEEAVEKIKEIARKGKKSAPSKKKVVSSQQSLFGEETEETKPNTQDNGLQTNDESSPERMPADDVRHEQRSQREQSADGERAGQESRGTESVRRGDSTESDRSVQPGLQQLTPKNTRNNHAERGTDYAPKGVDARIEANIKAIELMQQLIESGEQATPEQMAVLRQFSGWGGLGKAFQENGYGYGIDPTATSRRLRELLGDEAYEQANMSRNSAYYTPAEVIDTLWDIARAMGFKGGNVLEGSAGIGNIIGLMPTDMSQQSSIHAVEIDQTTGNILSLLYPDARVEVQGFEATQVENGSVDLAITNVPFVPGMLVPKDTSGDSDLSRKFHNSIQDFCIAKNIRKLRDGGIGIFITSRSTLDESARLREWIIQDGNADVVGAFRLHNDTFGGTGATSDIIVVRKRVNGKKSPHAIDISTVSGERVAEYDTGETKKVKGQEVRVVKQLSMDYNKYFIEHPEMMAGEMGFAFEHGSNYRATSKALYPTKDKDQSKMLADFVKSFEGKEWEAALATQQTEQANVYEELGADVKEGSLLVNKDGVLCVAQRGKAVPLEVNANKVKGHTKVECFKAYQAIKQALADVLTYQTENETDEGLQPLLDKLNRAFDGFVKTYGHLHKNTAITFLKSDVDWPSILALEKFAETGSVKGDRVQSYGKTDIFSKRVVEKEKAPEPKNVKDGIIASIYMFGRVDVPYISEHLGMSEEEVRKAIVDEGLGFENPATRQMEVTYEYLSGNVREKLQQARDNNTDGRYDANIKALEKVIPMNIPAHLIDFTIGSSWIDPKLYEEFVKERTDIDVRFTAAGGTWFMKAPNWVGAEKNRAMGVMSEMLGKRILGTQLIEAAMQNKTITVSDTRKHSDGTSETIIDKEATQACASKIDEIRQDFKDWARAKMQSDPEMSERMERVYNEMFNNYVPRQIPDDFVPQYFGGATHSIQLRSHQAKAVIRGTTQPLLLAHEVGTGKTFTLISIAMEMRRLGTAKKPMIVVQNATVGQFVESAKLLYPNAKVLTIEEADRTVEGRKNFYAKIKYNDWDMIVVPQSVFERIPDSEERQMAFVQDKIEEKLLVLEQMREADDDGNNMIVRQAEREISQLEDQLAGLSDAIAEKRKTRDAKKEAVTRQNAEVKALEMLDRQTDDVENFDDMGIDAILVDEAHEYKHLGFATAMQRGVKGVDPSYSKKAQGVFLKTQAVLEKNNGRNVVFATGTPISNTAAEIWTFMRYLMPADTMKQYGIYYFDDFVRNFGNLQQMLEFTTSGKFKENNRFAGYVNLPELVRIWSGVADTVLTREAGGVNDKIPDMEGGKAQDIYLPQTKALRSIMKFVKGELERFEQMSGKRKKENSHIPLVMYGIAKAAAVDARLVDETAEDDPNSKTNEAVRQTLRSLEETKDYRGTVAIFADNYQNKVSGFNIYEDIRKKLIEAGVPEEQIVVMKSGMSVKKKLEIFDKMNRGEVRVMLGSTFTLGTGVNIQERLHTLIHLDAPNRPMDYTQRNGRILRQGNLHKQMGKPVRVLRFGVEDSLDVTAYQRLKTKGAIADSIMNGKAMMANSMENRVLEEEEDVFGDTVAQLSGSEYAMLKNQAEKDVRKYQAKQKQWEADQTYVHNQIPRLQGSIRAAQRRLEEEKGYLEKISAIPEHPTITIGKYTFKSLEEMADFIKEYNAELKQDEAYVRGNMSNGEKKERTLTVNVGGIDFKIHLVMSLETVRKGTTLSSVVKREMTYECPALGLENVPVHQMLLRNALDDILTDVVTGNDCRGNIESAERIIERDSHELEQLKARDGKPFEWEKELQQARERLEEYTAAMKKEMEEKEAKYAEMDSEVEAATGLVEAEEAEEEETPDLSIREEEPPVRTGIGYKVFVLKDGKLYPPMVANPNGEATPVGVWLDADAAPIAGESKTGRPQVKAGGKGTQGGSGQLAYRPGWHLGVIPYAIQFNRKDENGEKTLFPKDFVWAEVEYADDVDYQQEAESYGVTENGKYRHSYAGLPRVPKDGSYTYRTNPNPETDPWIITGAMKVKRILTPSEVDAMVKEAGREPQRREKGAVTDEEVNYLNGKADDAQSVAYKAVREALANAGIEVVEATTEDVEKLKASIRSIEDSKGVVRGWVGNNGKIYLTKDGMTAETPIHEYTHLWAEALQMNNPELWEQIKGLLKDTPEWKRIASSKAYSYIKKHDEDRLAGEVLAHISGKKNAERMEAEAKRMIDDADGFAETAKAASLLGRMRDAVKKFWTWVGKTLLGRKGNINIDQVSNMVLADLVNGVDPFNPNNRRRSRRSLSIEDVNERFNEDLEGLSADNARETLLNCGNPSSILLSCGIADKPIRLYGAKLMSKARKHGYKVTDIKDLPKALAHPIAVFIGANDNSYAILTELSIDGKNVLATLSVGKGGHDVDFNIISSVYGKREDSIIHWINNGKLLYVDKEKALGYISDSAPIAEAQYNQGSSSKSIPDALRINPVDYIGADELNSAANIVENFENPQLEGENFSDVDLSIVGPENYIANEYNRKTGYNGDGVSGYVRSKEELIRSFFDGLRPLEQMQQLIEKALGRKLRDSENAYGLATLLPSLNKAMMDKAETEFMLPVLRRSARIMRRIIKGKGVSMSEAREMLNNYLLAKHGLERNEWFYQQALANDPDAEEEDKAGLRGLAESLGENPDDYKDVAQRIVDEMEDDFFADDIWDDMKALTDRMLEISYESGMISKDTFESLKARHQYYVPLRGFADGTSGDLFDYVSCHPHFQSVLKKMKGRKSKADDPLANLYNMLQSAVVIGNQNKVMQCIYNLAVNSKSDLLRVNRSWYVYNDATDEWEERFPDIPEDATADEIDAIMKQFDADMQQLKQQGKAEQYLNKMNLGKRVLSYQAKEHEMTAYINGRKVMMHVAGNPLVAQQFNKTNTQQLGWFAETVQALTRFASRINTSLSPAFMFTNAARDIGFSLYSATVTGGLNKNLKMVGNLFRAGWVLPRLILTGKMDGGITKMFSPTEAAKIEQWWNEFLDNGGETGFTNTLSAEKAKGQVDDMLRRMINYNSKDGQLRLKKATLGVIETMGRYSEDISRFAAYCLKRAEGETVKASVNEAKNVTVNFNVKGGGNSMVARFVAGCRSCYSFFNASLQGINRMGKLAKENPKAFAACLMACVLQGAMLPWLNMALFAMLGGDDDDWEKYEMLSEYTANHNLIIYVGNHKFLKIPYSQELAPFAAMGNIWFRQQMGWNHGRSIASQIGNMFLDLSPVNIGESKTTWGKLAKTITPTIAMPLTEWALNENFTASPIEKRYEWNKFDSGWEKAYENRTSKWLIDASRWLDEKSNGKLDVNPSFVEHITTGMLGGIGRSGDNLMRYFSEGFQMQNAPYLRTIMFDSKQQGYIGAVSREYGRLAYEVLPKMKHDVDGMSAVQFAQAVNTVDFQIANTVAMYKTGKDLLGNPTSFQGIDKMEKEYKKARKAAMESRTEGTEQSDEYLEAMREQINEMKMQMLDAIQQVIYENSGEGRKGRVDRVREIEAASKEKN